MCELYHDSLCVGHVVRKHERHWECSNTQAHAAILSFLNWLKPIFLLLSMLWWNNKTIFPCLQMLGPIWLMIVRAILGACLDK